MKTDKNHELQIITPPTEDQPIQLIRLVDGKATLRLKVPQNSPEAVAGVPAFVDGFRDFLDIIDQKANDKA